jgi:hypothetical protein
LIPISLLRDGNFDLREFVEPAKPLPYWFRRIDGRIVSTYPVIPGLLNLPVYAVADALGIDILASKDRLSLISAAWISALSVLFIFLVLTRVSATLSRAFFFALVYAFATCVWSVASRALWQHGPALLFLTAALWLLWKKSPPATALAGLLLGLAVVTRPTNTLIALPLAVYVSRNRRSDLPRFAALGVLPILFQSFYSWVYWGSAFSLGHANPIPQLANFEGNPFIGLAGLLISPSRGLLVFSPIFLFSAVGAVDAWRRRRDEPLYRHLAIGTALLPLVYAKWTVWWGGQTFGYRFLIEMIPGLVVFLAIAWETRVSHSALLQTVFHGCLAWSLYVHFLGATVHPSDFNRRLDEDPRVLWSVRQSEIVLSTKKLLAQLGMQARV